MKRREIKFKSSNLTNTVTGWIYIPDGEIKGIVQISHGMAEYFERYDMFVDFLIRNGFAACGHDHIGHGKSVNNKSELGFFSKKDGYKCLISDLYKFNQIIKKEIPGKPHFLLGHSMGSFIARCYTTAFPKSIDGLLISGTAGKNPKAVLAIGLAKTIVAFTGANKHSKLLGNLTFADYNIKFKPIRTENDWLTRDESIVDKYIDDEYCNFKFTSSALRDLYTLLNNCNSQKWFDNIPKELPIVIFSGDMDPVGDYGRGVKEVYDRLLKAGHSCVSLRMYPQARHETLNEINRDEVFEDILKWLTNTISENEANRIPFDGIFTSHDDE